MWEATAEVANRLGAHINELAPNTVVKIFNAAKTDKNEIMTEVFKSKAIAVGSPTVGNDVLSSVAGIVHFMGHLKFKKKKAAAFGTYGWSGESAKIIKELLEHAGFETVDPIAKIKWTVKKDEDEIQIAELAKALVAACR